MSAVASTAKTVGVFAVVFILIYAVAGVLALFMPVWSLNYILMFTAMAVALNLFTYYGSAKLVLMSYRVKLVSPEEAPELHKMVDRISKAADLPKPKVGIMKEGSPNAFATGRNPKHAVICFTTGILDLLSDHELEGVVAHELSHVKNRDTLVMTAVATVAAFFAYVIQFGGLAAASRDNRSGGGGGIAVYILLSLVAGIAALLIRTFVSRRREFGADRTGAGILKDSKGLSKALMKLDYASRGKPMRVARDASAHLFIVNPFAGAKAHGLFMSHPPIQARIRALEKMDY